MNKANEREALLWSSANYCGFLISSLMLFMVSAVERQAHAQQQRNLSET
jgi:hypothetical protein